jgi:hypothetical protein
VQCQQDRSRRCDVLFKNWILLDMPNVEALRTGRTLKAVTKWMSADNRLLASRRFRSPPPAGLVRPSQWTWSTDHDPKQRNRRTLYRGVDGKGRGVVALN